MSVEYEWDVETVSVADTEDLEENECVEHNHCASFAEAVLIAAAKPPEGFDHVIVLVRDDDNGRSWAYYAGDLPERFSDANGEEGIHVPLRFHAEVARVKRFKIVEEPGTAS